MNLLTYLFPLVTLPFVTVGRSFVSYAALGDSYATGNGAGKPIGLACGKFSEAYPVQVAHELTLAFRNLACAGALMSTVQYTQLPWIEDSEVVSIQVGGNEADFFSLLNECVKQWKPVSSCTKEVVRAKDAIQSTLFIRQFDNLVARARSHAKSDGVLLVLGYARFFNDETDQCSRITFSKTNRFSLLTREKRKVFNSIISMLNMVIRSAAEAHGAVYVDIDRAYEGHRFCEERAVEPGGNISWFFNDGEHHMQQTSAADTEQAVFGESLDNFLDLTRTFHPTVEGHKAIAEEIIRVLHEM